jgi:hypothetical protein
VELNNAVKHGYKILKIFEVYHFTKRSTQLFKGYINLFCKIKQESSGWPHNDMSCEQKQQYIDEYFQHEGIKLDKDAIKNNPGMRLTNKNLLNALWGKFTESQSHRKHVLVNTSEDFYKYLTHPHLDIKDFHVLAPQTAQIEYNYYHSLEPECGYINIFIGIFTTAHARTRLYKELTRLQRSVIYFDTDSIVYEYDSNNINSIHPEYGNHLGQWTSEVPEGVYIVEFVSAGPKSYAYLTSKGDTVVKVKGFTLNYLASQAINFTTIKSLVLHYADADKYPLPVELDDSSSIPIVFPNRIKRNRFKLYGEDDEKRFKVTYDKRMICEDGTFDTLPWGWRS